MGGLDASPAYEMLRALLEALESAGLGCTVIASHADRMQRVYANEAIARIFGLDLETTQRLDVLSMFEPEDRARLVRMRESVVAGGVAPSTVQTKIVRADGEEVPVEAALGHAQIGNVTATAVFLRDVAASAKMEAALRESEDRFRRLAEASPDSITVFADGRYLYANRVALGHLGISSLDELAAVDPWARVAPERREEILEHVARLERGENLPALLHRVTTGTGSEIVLESSLSFMKFDGRSALVSWTRDITERMTLQAELMKRDRLASVGLLAAGVAHEINNPLTALALQAHSLRSRADDLALPADVRESLANIDDAAQRMRTIIRDLLFMARPVEQPQAHVDVAAILSSTISLLRAGRANVPTFSVELAALPPVRAYASKLAQVFFNVLQNAIQAVETTTHGEISVRGRALTEHVEIVISDNGPGIARELLPRIAQPFFTTRPDGTGLGLWMSHSIMALHGGSLDVSGADPAGTTVTLKLPA